MTLKRAGDMHQLTITDHFQLMHYLETEGSEGIELVPLLKSKLGSALRTEVQSVRYRAPHLVVMVAETIEPIELAQEGPDVMRPVSIRSITLDDSNQKVYGQFGFTEALINTCTEPDIAVELGLMWPAQTDKTSLLKQVESLEIELESAQEINTLLVDLAQGLALEKGEQLQEQITDSVSSRMLNNSPASQLVASTGDDLSDLFNSPLGGILQDDIRNEIRSQINKLHTIDRLALCLSESGEVLKDWVDNQFCAFPTPTSCTEIDLGCEDLVGRIAREVESRIHLESDE